MPTIYAGPGKLYHNSLGFQADGENGQITIAVNEERVPVASAMFGAQADQLVDQVGTLTIKPFDHWGLLRTLFPATLGVSVGASAGALVIGTRPHGNSNVPAKVWTPDGRIYDAVRTAFTGHPTLHLGVGKGLYDQASMTLLGDPAVTMGSSSYMFTSNAITESAGADPGGAMSMSDFVRGAWVGAWGAVSGFDAVQAEDEWTINNEIKYSPLKVQGRTVAMKLDSVKFMARCRPYGPTHTQILARIFGHTHGQRLGSADLVLTGPSSKTITLKNAEVVGAGFEFGGTQLGSGEIGFVNEMTFSAGAAQPLLVFSA